MSEKKQIRLYHVMLAYCKKYPEARHDFLNDMESYLETVETIETIDVFRIMKKHIPNDAKKRAPEPTDTHFLKG